MHGKAQINSITCLFVFSIRKLLLEKYVNSMQLLTKSAQELFGLLLLTKVNTFESW